MKSEKRAERRRKMDKKLGGRIAALRKERGWTQENLAQQLGVSAAAVSKWENGASCPDIALLCPLARALGTSVDHLLAFEEKMPPNELAACTEKFIGLARRDDMETARRYLNDLLHVYPGDCALKLAVAGWLAMLQVRFPEAEEIRKQRRALYEAVHASGNEAQRQSAANELASIAIQEDRTEDARRYLEEIGEKAEDAAFLRVQLYQKTGENDKALEEIQKQLYRAVSQTLQMLIMLMQMKDDAMEALDIAQTYRKVESIFAVGGGMSAGLLMQQYMSMGRKKEALACLKEMADAATGKPMTPNPTLFYPTLEPKERRKDAGRELRAALLRGLKEDETLSGMRGEKEYEDAVAKLEESLKSGGE